MLSMGVADGGTQTRLMGSTAAIPALPQPGVFVTCLLFAWQLDARGGCQQPGIPYPALSFVFCLLGVRRLGQYFDCFAV